MKPSNIQRLATAPAECVYCGSRRALWTKRTTDYGCGARAVLTSDDRGPEWRFTRLCVRTQGARALSPVPSTGGAVTDPEQPPPAAARLVLVGTMRGLRRLVEAAGEDFNVSIVAIAETVRVRAGFLIN
ncbi:MAG: hypothetical protein AMXMBFR64_57530 [Myxococcales bacterium]